MAGLEVVAAGTRRRRFLAFWNHVAKCLRLRCRGGAGGGAWPRRRDAGALAAGIPAREAGAARGAAR